MSAVDMLRQRMRTRNTLACCGLDPDLRRLPVHVTRSGNEYSSARDFLFGVIDATAEHVCAYKAQKAFFDIIQDGHTLLAETIAYIHSHYREMPVFVDCKIGDIDNTMAAYTSALFDFMNADGVVVNPYMGDEVMAAFSEYPDRAIIVLARTSNRGAAIVQDAYMADGRSVWEYVLDLIIHRWNDNDNMIPVVSSTTNMDLASVRRLMPDEMPVLLAGVGAQGGDYHGLANLLNSEGIGVFVNSSRGILYPSGPDTGDWREAVERAAIGLKAQLNGARGILS